MSIENLGAKIIQNLAPKLGQDAGKKADAAAARMAPDLLSLDKKVLSGLNYDSVKLVAKLNGELRKSNPEELARKLVNMAKSPARYLSGQPEVMAYDMRDLAKQAGGVTGVMGDMHMRNAGTVLKASGKIKYRFNDFDEATVAPAAVDFNRMASHMVLVGRDNGFGHGKTRDLVERFAKSYYDTLEKLAKGGDSKIKLAKPDVVKDQLKKVDGRKLAEWLDKNAPEKHGVRQLPANSWNVKVSPDTFQDVSRAVDGYRQGLPEDLQAKLANLKVTDVKAISSGTGSAGEQRFHVLLTGGKHDDPVLLQLKEQGMPALDKFVSPRVKFGSQAERNVAIANLMDGNVDPMRGMTRLADGTDMLVEHMTPATNILEVDGMKFGDMKDLAAYDGALAAKGHARGELAGLSSASDILKTLGSRDQFVDGLVDFSHQYADVTEQRHAALVKALKHDPTLAGYAG